MCGKGEARIGVPSARLNCMSAMALAMSIAIIKGMYSYKPQMSNSSLTCIL
jgi:hypothetical protein